MENFSNEILKAYILYNEELEGKMPKTFPLFKEALLQLTEYGVLKTKNDLMTFLDLIFNEDGPYTRSISNGTLCKDGNIMLEVPYYDNAKKKMAQSQIDHCI